MAGMLENKVALITGAAGGIGRAAAVLFAREGGKLVISDVNQDELEKTAAAVREVGGTVYPITSDITRRDQIEAMVTSAVSQYGQLDCAFNNAGVTGGQLGQGGRYTTDWEEDAFDRIIAINLKGTWLCMAAELRQMSKQQGGAIINTASLAGIRGFITTSGYAASKHAIVGMTKTAALEYAPSIRVNALCPGYVDTPMLEDTMARRGDMIRALIPYKRLADAQEIAEMACWALSDRASYATGQAFTVDGGFTAA